MSANTPSRPRRAAAAGLGALALGAALTAAPASAADEHAAEHAAEVWLTTADGEQALDRQPDAPFTGDPLPIDIAVDPGERGRPFTGAGASVTEASAHLISGLPEQERDALLTDLFSAESGIGLDYLRQPFGSTDFNAGDFYTYEDVPGEFGIDRDRAEIIPVLHDALAANPDIRFMATPWSPPAWMKDGGSLNGGSLAPEHYRDYADYLVRAVQAYAEEGVRISELTVQNEPLLETGYPSTAMSAAEQAELLSVLDGALGEAGLDTSLVAYDHNWDRPDYPLEVLERTSGIDRVAGAAFHCYAGTPDAQRQVAETGARVFFSECSGTDSEDPSRTFADTLRWQAENLVVGNMRSGGETVVLWNLALDPSGGPHQGNCQDRCNGVVEIDGDRVTRNAEYYVLGHLTSFVDPGAHRIGSTDQGGGGVRNVVFENPDGTRTAYVVNTASEERAFSITDQGASLATSLPAGAVASYTWTPAADS